MFSKTSFYNIDKVIELGEGQFIEFKESFDKTIQKEIVAFANASGGVIYLGINDVVVVSTGKISTMKNLNTTLNLRVFQTISPKKKFYPICGYLTTKVLQMPVYYFLPKNHTNTS